MITRSQLDAIKRIQRLFRLLFDGDGSRSSSKRQLRSSVPNERVSDIMSSVRGANPAAVGCHIPIQFFQSQESEKGNTIVVLSQALVSSH